VWTTAPTHPVPGSLKARLPDSTRDLHPSQRRRNLYQWTQRSQSSQAFPRSEPLLDDIEDRYEDVQAANVALDKIHYAQFSTLETIVTSVEACWETCGFTTKGKASTDLHRITELRNDVAHANLLVENTDSNEFLSSGRTTENLYDTLETIRDVLSNLQDTGYDPGATNARDSVTLTDPGSSLE